ncbi:N-acetyl-alpha-D-glucosaminyl L-malate synthase BshA [Fuchsiella alkaliacetigena]|uniref:N-acetyl-alpha-D-glucosaminyl L-malate synthase BshA n=1 Tax=Fuchsiella alkaliacetigena TaxID=957042 RepID=UPI00200B39C9|nr:N-acetyl-alpha-D-glucosaminyl L-malate synthase BshA [Fuchsiella alkaliacetigena]MCK8824068.1 N-acetyl-alpha-D-glucosaminyl L-malate synthase BshA [Fuchsiella alkaliacetigena]
MKIGIVCYPSYGGSGVVATELGKQLAQRGHEIHFISYEQPFRLDQYYENLYFHEVDIPSYPLFKYLPYSLALTNKIVELIAQEGLEIIHAHYAIPHSLAAFLASTIKEQSRVKVVTTLHGTDITLVGKNSSFEKITKFSIEASDGITTVSESLKQNTIETFGIAPSRIEAIYNFIDTKEYCRGTAEQKFSWNRGKEKNIIHISNFREVKNIPDVIEIFAQINREVKSNLLLVGDGPQRHKAKGLVNKLGLEERVYFLGKQDNVISLLSSADLFLLPSAKESFGLVAVEAMACRVPVIASRTGGLPEVVKDGVTGFLAPPGAIAEMASYGIELLQNQELQSETAQNARHWVVRKFNAEQIVTQYENYYRKLVNN